MTILSKNLILAVTALPLALIHCDAAAQGYYYPPQPVYYPQYQPQQYPQYNPNQRQPSRPADQSKRQPKAQQKDQVESKKSRKPARDISADSPPVSDYVTSGAMIAYTWDFSDTLSDLAEFAGLTPNQLLSLNNLALSQLRDGQVLRIPHHKGITADGLDIELDQTAQISREVWRGVRGKKQVALTYDAGGETDGLETLLTNLTDLNAAATFFVTGKFGKNHPKLVENISKAGFPVHNHSWSHPEFTSLQDDAMAKELSRTDDVLSSITGQSTKPFWRPPFGDRDDRVLKTTARQGYQSIYWTLDTLDSVNDKKDTAFVVNKVLYPSKAKSNPDHFLDGAIILMHVGETGTANAVPEIVKGLRDRGFTLVTVEEILRP